MTDTYLKNISPDSFSGLIFGLEGIRNVVVVLNGPTGCKFYHSSISDDQCLRQWEYDPMNYPLVWYFGQPRIPCTYLDKRDYIYGSRAKLEEVLDFILANNTFDLLAVVNSPGAALIGDNLEQIVSGRMGDRPYLVVESPGYSRAVWNGYDQACQELIRRFARPAGTKTPGRKKVNLLGLSIFQKNYEGNRMELVRLLDLCGIDVNCALCCQCSLDQIRHLGDADLNVVLYPEYGTHSAEILEERFGMPWLRDLGLPLGFAATEQWLRSICGALGCDPGRALAECERARARSYIHVSRVNSLTGLPKGVKFAVHGTCSQCYAYASFLIGYFGMDAECIHVLDGPGENPRDQERLRALLEDNGMMQALSRDILETDAELVFADANILAKLKLRHHRFTGVEIGLPSFGYVNVVPKPTLGILGSLLICEQVLNGLLF